MTVTIEEHLAWCKERALEYVEAGDVKAAFTSLLSDVNKHEETKRLGVLVVTEFKRVANGEVAPTKRNFRRFLKVLT